MAAKKGGLGKGLDVLIPTSKSGGDKKNQISSVLDAKEGEQVHIVKITQVEPNKDQPRKTFSEDELQELSDSIKQVGLINPIIVQDRKSDKDHYMIIAGERRWRASRMAGLTEIPIVIRHYTEKEIVEISLIDNLQRTDLNPIEEALTYKKLLDDFGMKQDEVAERVSKSRSAVTNSVRLLKLCENVQQMIIDELISEGAARALIGVEDPDKQYELAQQIYDKGLNVREVEKMVKDLGKTSSKSKSAKTDEKLETIYREYEEKLKKAVGTKIAISSKGDGSGKLEIDFYSHDDLDRITSLLTAK
ncbi:chromosome partitioning protein, ParB family [Lachnospiraceae bacterium XBB2008]|nr:chromosome partitioning protein, ParB family [Lachnospiraceae bacterium XBB2008]